MKIPKRMRTHTVAKRKGSIGWVYFCTSCGKELLEKDRTKRCKSSR